MLVRAQHVCVQPAPNARLVAHYIYTHIYIDRYTRVRRTAAAYVPRLIGALNGLENNCRCCYTPGAFYRRSLCETDRFSATTTAMDFILRFIVIAGRVLRAALRLYRGRCLRKGLLPSGLRSQVPSVNCWMVRGFCVRFDTCVYGCHYNIVKVWCIYLVNLWWKSEVCEICRISWRFCKINLLTNYLSLTEQRQTLLLLLLNILGTKNSENYLLCNKKVYILYFILVIIRDCLNPYTARCITELFIVKHFDNQLEVIVSKIRSSQTC